MSRFKTSDTQTSYNSVQVSVVEDLYELPRRNKELKMTFCGVYMETLVDMYH
jgi:hypothetical protein